MAEPTLFSSTERVVQPPQPSLPPPPPPPAPPPLINVNSITQEANQSKGRIADRPSNCSSADEQGRKAFQSLCSQGLLTQCEEKDHLVLSCCNPVNPVLQNGPVCGLVALSMASQLCSKEDVSTDIIFSEAQRRGYSKQGEMFSVSYLQELASHFLSCPVDHLFLDNNKPSEQTHWDLILNHLLQGNILLIPYDADKNHSPCEKRGHKAHWALITGVIALFPSPEILPSWAKSECKQDTEISSLLHWPENAPMQLCNDLATHVAAIFRQQLEASGSSVQNIRGPSLDLYVYGYQGKSRHTGVWPLKQLLLSNAQLIEAGPERDAEGYVLPPGGVTAGLKSQLLVLRRRSGD